MLLKYLNKSLELVVLHLYKKLFTFEIDEVQGCIYTSKSVILRSNMFFTKRLAQDHCKTMLLRSC